MKGRLISYLDWESDDPKNAPKKYLIRYQPGKSNIDVFNVNIHPDDLTDELKEKAEKKGLIQEWGIEVEFNLVQENGMNYGKLV